jgi:hypothetical protein
VRSDDAAPDVVGSIVSRFDPDSRTGFELSILTAGGVTSTAQPNYRSLQFGLDWGTEPQWMDCGRPGNAVLITSLKVLDGRLYAGSLETGPQQAGRLWRYEADGSWTDLGNPLGCNCIHSVGAYDGALYCGTGRYYCTGSRLGETLNATPGGRVYRVDVDGTWHDCGRPGAEGATPDERTVRTTGRRTTYSTSPSSAEGSTASATTGAASSFTKAATRGSTSGPTFAS